MVTIEATNRDGRGKGYARRLRRAGKIPAVLLDAGKSVPLELNPKLLSKAYLSEGRKFTLKHDGKESAVYIKEMQVHSVKRVPLHVDLMYAK